MRPLQPTGQAGSAVQLHGFGSRLLAQRLFSVPAGLRDLDSVPSDKSLYVFSGSVLWRKRLACERVGKRLACRSMGAPATGTVAAQSQAGTLAPLR